MNSTSPDRAQRRPTSRRLWRCFRLIRIILKRSGFRRRGAAARRRRARVLRHRLFGWKAQRLAAVVVVLAAALVAAWAITFEVAMWRGYASLEARQHKRAMLWLRLADMLSSEKAELHYLLARCHRRLGEFESVKFHLTRAAEMGWPVAQLRREQWLALAQTGQYDQVKRYWPVLFENPGSDGPEICKAYVTAAFGLFRIKDALGVLDGWERDFPDDPEPHIMRGQLAATQFDWGQAVGHYSRALELAPDRTDARFGLAKALIKQGEIKKASEELRRVLREEPTNLAAKVSSAECMDKLGRRNNARKLLSQVLKKEPDNADALLAQGNLELASGQSRRALSRLQHAAKLRPESREVVYAYARALQAEGRADEARKHFEFVAEATPALLRRKRLVDRLLNSPDDVDLRFEIGALTWRYKSREDGVNWWRSLLLIDPDHRPTHAALAEHYALLGDRERAAHHRALAGDSRWNVDRGAKTSAAPNDHQSRPRGRDNMTRQRPTEKGEKTALSPMNTAARFVDVAPQAGLEFVPRNGREANHATLLETLGVGVALFDYDGDHDLDVFFPGGGYFGDEREILGLPPALFRNDGRLRFTEVTQQAGVAAAPFYSHGAFVGDYDNDGTPDLLVTGYGGLLLYRNNGDGTFTQVAEQAGLTDSSWSTGAAWGDMNSDGHLDLYLAHYVDWSFDNHPFCGPSPEERDTCSPTLFNALSDRFFLSGGDGTFRDATNEVGLVEGGKGLAVLAADLDLDGDLDYYVANDGTPNRLYRNQGKGRLEEIGIMSGAGLNEEAGADGSMGVDLGDFDLDGKPDLWVANFEDQSCALYRNQGDCLFQYVSSQTGVSRLRGVYVGFGTVFFDFDRDGDEDIFVSNGHVVYHSPNAPYRQRPLLFENQKGKQFVNVAPQAGAYTRAPHVGRGVAMGDLDHDGDVDLVVAHTNEPVALLSNRSKSEGHWLRLRLIGLTSHRDAVGARVRIQMGRRTQTRQVKSGASYFSSNDPALSFGLGQRNAIDRIEIDWPSGRKQTLPSLSADQTVIVHEPAE